MQLSPYAHWISEHYSLPSYRPARVVKLSDGVDVDWFEQVRPHRGKPELHEVPVSVVGLGDAAIIPGRYGAHNIHENRPGPLSLGSNTLVYATFFNAGIRVFDTTNPFQPQEAAHYFPQTPEGADANGINDVHVDENGMMYVVDRLQGGLYILELNL